MNKMLLIPAAVLAAAVPTSAIAAVKTEGVNKTQRDRAIAAAKKSVPSNAKAVKVERDSDDDGDRTAFEVTLRSSTTEYDVDLTRNYRVIKVDRDRLDADDRNDDSGRDHAEDD